MKQVQREILNKVLIKIEKTLSCIGEYERKAGLYFNNIVDRFIEARLEKEHEPAVKCIDTAYHVKRLWKAFALARFILENTLVKLESIKSIEDLLLIINPTIESIEALIEALTQEAPGIAVRVLEIKDLLENLRETIPEVQASGEDYVKSYGARLFLEANSIAVREIENSPCMILV